MEISILPIGKLLLWNKFNLTNFCFFKFILISIITSIFYGFFSLWLSSFVKDLENSGWMWARVINPIYMFCGYFSTWQSIYQTNNIIGYLHFLNPLLYAIEGTRAAFLGQNGYLNFWICLLMLMFFIFIFGYLGIKKFKKRVDFV